MTGDSTPTPGGALAPIGSSTEPEDRRVANLLDRVTRAEITDAEKEELAMYADANPALRDEIARRAREAELGDGWLQRVEADHRVARVEESRRVRVEQGAGLALMGGGFVTTFFLEPVGALMLLGGLLLLIWSAVRVRLATHRDDPYKDVKR